MDVIIPSLGKPMFLIAANSLQCRICIREFNQPPKGQPTMINSCKVRLHYQLLVANKAFLYGPSNISWLLGSPLGVESPTKSCCHVSGRSGHPLDKPAEGAGGSAPVGAQLLGAVTVRVAEGVELSQLVVLELLAEGGELQRVQLLLVLVVELLWLLLL